MAREFLDYDPLTGLAEYYEEHSDGRISIHTMQDVQPAMDAAQRLRNMGGPDDAWNETGTTVYAALPLAIVGKMMKEGINIFDQNDMPRVLKEVNSTYSNFKTTYKHHEL